MSNLTKKDITVDSSILASAALNSLQQPAVSLDDQIKQLQLEELQRVRNIRESSERDQRVARDSNVREIAKKLREKEELQAQCPHRKPPPSFQSALAGQRDHQGIAHFICQYCQKEWTGSTVPPELRIDGGQVGGPIL